MISQTVGNTSHKPATKAERMELRRLKSAKRQWKLAKRLEDPAMLVASLAFYTARLKPGKRQPAELVDAASHAKGRKWKPYLSSARRILGISYLERLTVVRLPKNYLRARLTQIGLRLVLNPEDRKRFEALNSDLAIDASIQSFAANHPSLLERCQIYLEQNYRPSLRERIGRPELPDQEKEADKRRQEQKAAQWWVSPLDEQPGPFAGRPDVEQPTRHELPGDLDDEEDPDDGEIRYTSPRIRRISRQEELRAIEAEDRPESVYTSRVRTRVIYRPGQDRQKESLPQPRHPYAAQEPDQGRVTPATLLRGSVRAHLARRANS